MEYHDVIIVGGGPAGSTCAWKLRQNSFDCIILDKKPFPRPKVCAGWITPKVVHDLQLDPMNYPYSFITFNRIYCHFHGSKIVLRTSQHSIRRYEFDYWLLERTGVPVYTHQVRKVIKKDSYYIIDNQYRCKYLIGAAGTYCPVYRTFFKKVDPRAKKLLITGMEDEFTYNYKDANCYLWFFEKNLPGYAWYVPKGDGYLNVGIGGSMKKLKNRNTSIKYHWNYFIQQLEKHSLISNHHFSPRGYNYYLRQNLRVYQLDKAYIIGDSAGLATRDMGEGISPAVRSGILAAHSIIGGIPYWPKTISRYSLIDMILSGIMEPNG
ncbi:MAG: NAD(P)/FAD-dependent oxidoreductase [Candidatus Marinimicrobia bacterium]|nr:NAD(P)/FAD-dependent oxidoreductase [Candidatus Neomarinimicrobiota bacterium]